MNRLSSYITLYLCFLCLFIIVIHADTTEITETTTNFENANSTIEVQQIESSITSPTETSPNNNDPIDGLPSSSLPPSTDSNNSITCRAVGECVPCSAFELKLEPYCQGFGNKEKVECQYDTPGDQDGPLPTTYQACKRVKKLERARYFEFQFVNILIAFMSCSLLLWRRKKLAADGYRRLSRRIRGNA